MLPLHQFDVMLWIHQFHPQRRMHHCLMMETEEKSRSCPGGMGPYTGRDPTVKKSAWLRLKAPQGERFEEIKESLSNLKQLTLFVRKLGAPILERFNHCLISFYSLIFVLSMFNFISHSQMTCIFIFIFLFKLLTFN